MKLLAGGGCGSCLLLVCLIVLAPLADGAVEALWLDGFAHIAAVEQNPMMGIESVLGCDVADESLLDLEGSLA